MSVATISPAISVLSGGRTGSTAGWVRRRSAASRRSSSAWKKRGDGEQSAEDEDDRHAAREEIGHRRQRRPGAHREADRRQHHRRAVGGDARDADARDAAPFVRDGIEPLRERKAERRLDRVPGAIRPRGADHAV